MDDLFRVRPCAPDPRERGIDEAGDCDLAIGVDLLLGCIHVGLGQPDCTREETHVTVDFDIALGICLPILLLIELIRFPIIKWSFI